MAEGTEVAVAAMVAVVVAVAMGKEKAQHIFILFFCQEYFW